MTTATLTSLTPAIAPAVPKQRIKALVRRILVWAFPELAQLKVQFENIHNVRNGDIPRLEQRFNNVLPAIEQWHGHGPAKWCHETRQELGTDIKALQEHVNALREHRTRHDVRLQCAEAALRKAGRI